MKTLYALIACFVLSISISLAQISFNTTPADSTQRDIEDFYNAYSKKNMEGDLLWNFAYWDLSPIELVRKNGFLHTDFGQWSYYLDRLHYASVSGTFTRLNAKDLKKEVIFLDEEPTSIPLAAMYYRGEYLDSASIANAEADNTAPYFKRFDIFAVTPLQSKFYQTNVTFQFDPKLLFSNILDINDILEVDFGDGTGYQEVSTILPSTLTADYDGRGEKAIHFRLIQHANNDTLNAFTTIFIKGDENFVPTAVGKIYLGESSAGRRDPDDVGRVHRGSYAYYEGIDERLDKAVIISEGFDIAGTESPIDIADKWRTVIDSLNNEGFDIYTLNYTASYQSVQNNARVVERMIRLINDEKIGNFETTYIGESMGGLTGRIALKRLENEGYDHQVGLFIAYDSPFKGANIPPGMQWLAKDAIGLVPGIELISATVRVFVEMGSGGNIDVPYVDIIDQLNSTAAQQLLSRHYLNGNYHAELMEYLEDLGYPEQCRKVAIVNGSNIGLEQEIPELGAKAYSNTFGFWPVRIHADAWYSDVNRWNQRVSRLHLDIGIRFRKARKRIRHYDFDQQPLDVTPGGNIETDITGTTIQFSFVPTVSAIDLRRDLYDQNNFNFYNRRNRVQNIRDGHTPFDDILSLRDNSSHVSRNEAVFHFVNRGGNLIENEIMPNNHFIQDKEILFSRDFEASDLVLVGSDVNTSAIKNISNADAVFKTGTVTNIEASQLISLMPGSIIENGATVNLTLANDNPNLRSIKEKNVAKTLVIESITNSNLHDKFTISEYTISDNLTWSLIGMGQVIELSGDTVKIPSSLKSGMYTLTLNSKGDSYSKAIPHYKNGNNEAVASELKTFKSSFTVYPNPTTQLIKIESNDQGLNNATFELLNMQGSSLDLIWEKEQEAVRILNISHLAAGNYILNINKNESYKIIKH